MAALTKMRGGGRTNAKLGAKSQLPEFLITVSALLKLILLSS